MQQSIDGILEWKIEPTTWDKVREPEKPRTLNGVLIIDDKAKKGSKRITNLATTYSSAYILWYIFSGPELPPIKFHLK